MQRQCSVTSNVKLSDIRLCRFLTMVWNSQESRCTGPFACPFAYSLALLTHSLAPTAQIVGKPGCAHLFTCSLTRLLTPKLEGKSIIRSWDIGLFSTIVTLRYLSLPLSPPGSIFPSSSSNDALSFRNILSLIIQPTSFSTPRFCL